MMADQPDSRSSNQRSDCELRAVNDSGDSQQTTIDPRLLTVARAIGKQMAREHFNALKPANDNEAEDAP